MKRFFLVCLALSFVSSLHNIDAQDLVLNSSITSVCYAGNKVNRIFIPPPVDFYKKVGKKGGATVKVTYTGFPNSAKVAMEHATTIISSILPPNVNLTINATWTSMSEAGILGSTGITTVVRGSEIDAINPNVYYPVALAEKIAGKSLNKESDGDMNMTLNSRVSWYTGIDGNTPINQYDFVTVVIHEIIHGLGFSDSFNSNNTIGWYGLDSVPIIYDTFIENQSGKRLVDGKNFLNFSTGLLEQMTGGNIFFNGPLLSNLPPGSRAKLYAPSVWNSGSSFSHLDEDETLQKNSLMTPFINKGEAIHNPGELILSILGDIGWINTRILYKPRKDTEEHLSSVDLSVKIKSDTLYNRNKIGFVYSFNKFIPDDTLYLTSPASSDSFAITLNIPGYDIGLSYYFFVEDCFKRLYKFPSYADTLPYRFYIGTDNVKPVVSHIPLESFLQSVDTIKFTASASDNIGIDTVYVEYKINNGISKFIGLSLDSLDVYSNIINVKPEGLIGSDSIQYRVVAIDKSSVHNISTLPSTGYYIIDLEAIESTVGSYVTDFSNAAGDFLNKGFSVTQPSFFSSPALHTKHPYESPNMDDQSLEFTAMLRHPVKVNASGLLIKYREIVLVEPGETGSIFGSTDFYDYVIIEGSKDMGKTWFRLVDGYDSRYDLSWETAYNSAKDDTMNSIFVGTESLFIKRILYPQPFVNLSDGDTVLVRFRLYSDPYAHGWGWVIDDLSINSLVNDVEKISSDPLILYPNPGNGLIKINDKGNGNRKNIRLSIYNSTGVMIKNEYLEGTTEKVIDISGYSAGIYIIVIFYDDGIKTIKYSLIK